MPRKVIHAETGGRDPGMVGIDREIEIYVDTLKVSFVRCKSDMCLQYCYFLNKCVSVITLV